MMNERIKNLIKKHGLSGVNKPKKTPSHPTKKGIVLAKEGDQVKLIRFGDQNMGHNYSPEARKSFKARHTKNIAKGKMSAAYWADKAFWGGEGADKKMPPKSQEYTRGLKNYQDGGKVPLTYPKKTLPTVDIVSDGSGTQYPYYKNLTDEEKRFFSSNTPIGRSVRAKAQTGKVGQTYNDLSKAAKTIGKTAAEFTGVPGAVRFSRNPSENLKGALSTIEKTIIGASPGVPQGSTPYDSKEVEGFFNTLDAAGLASTGAPLVKTGISGAKALPTVARQAGRYVTTQTPLKNAWRLNPKALKENPEMFLYRAEPSNFNSQSTIDFMKQEVAAGRGKPWYKGTIKSYEEGHPKLIAQNDFHGQWLEKDPTRLDWYLNSGDKVDVETPMSIFRTKIPTSEAAKYSVANNAKANVISSSPNTEFVMPRTMIEQGEKFPASSWQQLIAEDKAFNTPHWLRGYKPIEVPRRPPGSPKEMPKPRYAEGGKVATKSNPGLWKRIVASVKAGSKGGDAGEWSARKAQLAVQQYKKSGGSYKGPKKETSLSKWTKQEWNTSSGKPSEGKRRYLPKAAWSALSTAQKAATNKAKAEGNRQGKQFVPQPKSIAQKVKSYR